MQRPELTAAAVLSFLETVKGRAEGHRRAELEEARWIVGEVAVPQSRK